MGCLEDLANSEYFFNNLSAGGQLEQPWEVKSSKTAKLEEESAKEYVDRLIKKTEM
jgi:hypothetical protein